MFTVLVSKRHTFLFFLPYLSIQDYLREQPDNVKSFNIIGEVTQFLNVIYSNITAETIDLVCQLFDTMTEFTAVSRLPNAPRTTDTIMKLYFITIHSTKKHYIWSHIFIQQFSWAHQMFSQDAQTTKTTECFFIAFKKNSPLKGIHFSNIIQIVYSCLTFTHFCLTPMPKHVFCFIGLVTFFKR